MRFKTMSWRPLAVLALGVAVATPFAVALPGEAAAEIKICVIDDHSGDFALPNIPKTHGAQLAVDELNAGGGVNGEQIELIHYDGQSDVKRYQELANKCILDDEVDVIMAGYTSSEREAARAVAVKNKTIFGTTTRAKAASPTSTRSSPGRFQSSRSSPASST